MGPAKAEMDGGVLAGVRVVELAEGVAGPYCGRMLAAFGADVVKVERPPGGDWARRTAPLLPDVPAPESSALFLYLNSGKKSVMLDWQTADGCALLQRLLREADVLVGDTRPGVLEGFGLGFDRLQRTNPGLVLASITDFGDSGPYSSWTSTPLVNLALGGYLYLSGDEGREPLMLPGFQADYLAGLHGYLGVTMALWSRSETGQGQRVQVAAVESLGALHQFTTVMETYSGLVRRRHGNRFESLGDYARYPITLLPCEDGYVSFAVSSELDWETLCAMIERPDLLERPELATFLDRRIRADEIDEILTHWLEDKKKAEVVSLAAGTWSVPVAPLSDLADVLNDAQYRERGLWTTLDHPVAGGLTHPTVPFIMSETSPSFRRAPMLGEHNGEVLGSQLGRSDSDDTRVEQGGPRWDPGREGATMLTHGPLSDVRVLDLTRVWSGPLATRMLADFGAHVVRISDPRGPVVRTNGTNNKLGRNRLGIALRLDEPDGRQAFLDLVGVSDVVVENFRPRVMRNFDLGYDVLRSVRPDLVMCSMPGFGTQGAFANYPAFGPSVEAMTGMTSLMGYPGGPPMVSSIAYPDPVAGLNAAGAIMTALWHRRRTGQGQFIDLALSEGPVCQLGEQIVQFSRTGVQPSRIGNTHPEHAPYGCYPAAGEDQWIAICVTSDAQWASLRRLMGGPDWAMSAELDRGASRVRRRAELDDALGGWTSAQEPRELAARLQAQGIAAGAVLNNRQLLDDPHLGERGFFVEIDEPDLGVKRYPGQAIRMSADPARDWTPSPVLGEHTREVLGDLLGFADDYIEGLEAREAIGIWRELTTPT